MKSLAFGIAAIVGLALLPPIASAQAVKSQIIASNGVTIELKRDEFAGRSGYSSPVIEISGDGIVRGQFFVVKVIQSNLPPRIHFEGFVFYTSDWRRYASAIFRGGEAIEFQPVSKKVVTCRGGCILSEMFAIFPTDAQISKYTENGMLPIQIRTQGSGYEIPISVPINYIEAINELAK